MSKTNINASGSETVEAKAIVVFGIDEHDKPRAARFTDAKPDLIGKAAQLMELKLCEASSPETGGARQETAGRTALCQRPWLCAQCQA